MTTVLSIATALGIIGVVASFTLVVLADKVFSSGSQHDPDPALPQALGRRPPHDLPDPHPGTVLEPTPPSS